jgi:hypothetical protein
MAFILFRNDSVVVALDENGPQLIVMLFDPETETDNVLALVPLPANGIEILDWSEGKRPATQSEPPQAIEWAKRGTAPEHPAWRRPA